MPSFSFFVNKKIPPGLRLDRYIAEHLQLLSRSQIKARNLAAFLDGKAVKVSRLLKGGEFLELSWEEAESPGLIPEDLPLDVLYEDERVIVINKAQGLVVHPGAGNNRHTLANALLYRMLQKKKIALPVPLTLPDGKNILPGLRPGIVHRLDKDTSGVLIAAYDEAALAFLSEQFKARTVIKTYAAIVHGSPREIQGRVEKRIVRSKKNRKTFTVSDTEGRQSLTHYKVIKAWQDFSLLLLRPKTGRTHQIRVHLKFLGCPIIGDKLYGSEGSAFQSRGLMLHAKSLSLLLPGGTEQETFKASLPERFTDLIKILSQKKI